MVCINNVVLGIRAVYRIASKEGFRCVRIAAVQIAIEKLAVQNVPIPGGRRKLLLTPMKSLCNVNSHVVRRVSVETVVGHVSRVDKAVGTSN